MNKNINKVLFTTIIGLLFFGIFIVLIYFSIVQTKKTSNARMNVPNSSLSQTNLQRDTSLKCPSKLQIPTGYSYQNPINSFFGVTFKNGDGKICDVILGPDYVTTHEGFSGTQIQINAYSSLSVTPEMLLNEDQGIKIRNVPEFRYRRPGYGGEDQVLVIEIKDSVAQLIWREFSQKNEVEKIVLG